MKSSRWKRRTLCKYCICKKSPKTQKPINPQKIPSREYKRAWNVCQVTAVKQTMCGLSWSRNTKYSDKEGNIALHLFTNAYKSSECIAMLKISCCWSISWDDSEDTAWNFKCKTETGEKLSFLLTSLSPPVVCSWNLGLPGVGVAIY